MDRTLTFSQRTKPAGTIRRDGAPFAGGLRDAAPADAEMAQAAILQGDPEEYGHFFLTLAAGLLERLRGHGAQEEAQSGRGMEDVRIAAKELGTRVYQQLSSRANGCDRAVGIIWDYLRDNYAAEITLVQLASLVYMNPSYVSRLIKKETGRNFTELLMEIRMDKARELLFATGMKVYEVGEAVGIVNSKYFSQVFKKHTGLRPSEYRERGGL